MVSLSCLFVAKLSEKPENKQKRGWERAIKRRFNKCFLKILFVHLFEAKPSPFHSVPAASEAVNRSRDLTWKINLSFPSSCLIGIKNVPESFFFCQIKQKRIHAFWDDRKKIFCDASDVKKTFWWWWYLLCGKACLKRLLGSGCGSVGRAVASDTRGPRFESRHWQNLYWIVHCQLYWKDENKEKEAGNGPSKNIFSRNRLRMQHWSTRVWHGF